VFAAVASCDSLLVRADMFVAQALATLAIGTQAATKAVSWTRDVLQGFHEIRNKQGACKSAWDRGVSIPIIVSNVSRKIG